MSDFKRIQIKINAATGRQIDSKGAAIRESDYLHLLFDETVIICAEMVDVDWTSGAAVITEHAVPDSMTLSAFGDCDFDPETPFMFLSEQNSDPEINKVNAPGDWIGNTTADREKGQLSFRINTNTDRFPAALTAKKFYFAIIGIPAGETEKSILAYFQFKAENRPSSSAGEPVTADPEYLNAGQTLALLKVAPEYRFSVDGESNWHSIQTADDKFYQTRYPGGEWSQVLIFAPAKDGLNGLDGINGIDGVDGENGIDGLAGKTAYEIAVDNGFTGTEQEWLLSLKGADGQSTYELAVEHGFTGTSTEFLEFIKGERGDRGIDGIAPNFVAGSFTASDLVDGFLSVIHTNGNVSLSYVITDNDGKNVALDSGLVTYSNNLITVDLSLIPVITGTWKYSFGGVGTGTGGGGTGDVSGYTISEDSNLVIYHGTDGKSIKDSGISIADLTASFITAARTVNGKALSTNITITAADVGLGNVTNENKATMFTNPVFTGTVSGITKSMVGLNNVDNTSDANKPVSNAVNTALNLKANLANPTFTGTVNGITKAMVGLNNVPNTDTTNPANISQSASYRFVTDTEKAAWAGKQDALGYTPINPSVLDTDGTLSWNSDSRIATQKAVKTYVDAKVVNTSYHYQVTTPYRLRATDTTGGTVVMDCTYANTVLIPDNGTLPYAFGTSIWVVQLGAGLTTISFDNGVTVLNGSQSIGQYKQVRLFKLGTNTWIIIK